MVGTPQLPLKYRRKGADTPAIESDYRVYCRDIDMASASYRVNLGSDDSLLHSPGFSSSSYTASSPTRSMHTPEPPSSPFSEPYIASSSPKSFWEVAFNYGPGFPYKSRSSVKSSPTDSDFGRDKLFARRRSSSSTAPTLVSDAEPSEYSEDIDVFSMEEDVSDNKDVLKGHNITIQEDCETEGPENVDFQRIDGVEVKNEAKLWSGDIEIAAALLDLSRQVRIGSADPTTVKVAIKPIDVPLRDMLLPTNMTKADSLSTNTTYLSCLTNEDSHSVVVQKVEVVDAQQNDALDVLQSYSNTTVCDLHRGTTEVIDIPIQRTDEVSLAPVGGQHESHSPEEVEVMISVGDESAPTLGSLEPPQSNDALEEIRLEIQVASDGIKPVPESAVEVQVFDDDMLSEVDSVAASVFSTTLTPLSSPLVPASDPIEPVEPISRPLSPASDPSNTDRLPPTLVVISAIKPRLVKGKENAYTLSRPASPIPGPSKSRSASVEQGRYEKQGEEVTKPVQRKKKSRQVLSDAENETPREGKLLKEKMKRPREASPGPSRSTSPIHSTSSMITSRPRKKKSRKSMEDGEIATSTIEPLSKPLPIPAGLTTPNSAEEIGRVHLPSASLANSTDAYNQANADIRTEICGFLIQVMALSRASSMPASSLLREVLRENPQVGSQRSKQDLLTLVANVLQTHVVFGRIERQGLDAADKPLEAQWFYIPENDPDQDRAALLREMMPKKRNETKKHKQYYYRPLSKITRWDAEDDF